LEICEIGSGDMCHGENMGLLSGSFNPDMGHLQFNIVGIQVIASQVTYSKKFGEKFKLVSAD
jgi:hypothetical protein